MRRWALALLAAWPMWAAAQLPAPVRAALAKARVPEAAVAVVVQAADGGRTVASHQAAMPMNPASVMKVVTTYAALDLLGPAFTFKTDVLVTGTLAGGILDGDLVLRGGGDPKLTYERLWQVVRQLRARGLREVRGDVILDRGYFAPIAYDAGSFDKDARRAYNVGADALLVNFQAVDFRFVPEAGGVRVTAEPDLPNVEVLSRITPSSDACGAWRRDIKYEIDARGLLVTVAFNGSYPVACGERSWPLSVLDAAAFTEANLRWIWSETGGVLRGKVRPAVTPLTARLFYRHESEPLANLARDMNKFSNNVMARHVFLALSAERGGNGEAAASAQRVRDWLRARRIEAPELVLENGSGLSRGERASAATLAAILRDAWVSALMPEMVSSLPIYGVDGTLRSRRGVGAVGEAHLKGGTLADVQSIAGYVVDQQGRRWVTVMMVNHANAGAAVPAMDALVEWVHAQGRRRAAR
jgi:D-alanyl-D-alanine carboxypeptidase/D-alanyl-D-alanine-endopeptidase (penicillin-binding protein 4)